MKETRHRKRLTASQRIEVLLVDDHPAIREGLALLLAPEEIVVCGEASVWADALSCVEKRRPDLAVVDLSLDGNCGLAVITGLHRRGIPVLVYSMYTDAHHVEDAIAAGARGYVTKRDLNGVLISAIREVVGGRCFFSPHAAAALAQRMATLPNKDAVGKLSSHERKVYELVGEGADAYDIAAALGVTNHTVESYYSRILLKLGLSGMHELRRHAIAHLQKHTP